MDAQILNGIAASLALAALVASIGWWESSRSRKTWFDIATKWRERAETLETTASELFAQREEARERCARLAVRRDELSADISKLVSRKGHWKAAALEARAQLAMTLRRDPTTGRFMPRQLGETHRGDGLSH